MWPLVSWNCLTVPRLGGNQELFVYIMERQTSSNFIAGSINSSLASWLLENLHPSNGIKTPSAPELKHKEKRSTWASSRKLLSIWGLKHGTTEVIPKSRCYLKNLGNQFLAPQILRQKFIQASNVYIYITYITSRNYPTGSPSRLSITIPCKKTSASQNQSKIKHHQSHERKHPHGFFVSKKTACEFLRGVQCSPWDLALPSPKYPRRRSQISRLGLPSVGGCYSSCQLQVMKLLSSSNKQ